MIPAHRNAVDSSKLKPKFYQPDPRLADHNFLKSWFFSGINIKNNKGVTRRDALRSTGILAGATFLAGMTGSEHSSAQTAKKATSDELWHYAKVCRVLNILRPYFDSLA